MQNVLQNLGRRYAAPKDTVNSNYDMIDTGGVLPRGMERPDLLEIDLSPVDMDASDVDEVDDMSVRSPTGNITHQYAAKLSLEEADLYMRRLE